MLVWTLEANSYLEAMQAYYSHLNWGEYRPMLDAEGQPYPSDIEPYPEDWVATQRSSDSAYSVSRYHFDFSAMLQSLR